MSAAPNQALARKFAFVIAAGGSGSRMGGRQKQFLSLDGRPLWRWSADRAAPLFGEVILVLPEGTQDQAQAWMGDHKALIVAGGATRAESVLNGLSAASCEYVMIHDAARPFVGEPLLERLMRATTQDTGAVPLLPVSDAVKRLEGREGCQRITPVAREGLYVTQTPQSFYRPALIQALKQYGPDARDEAEAWLASGGKLAHVEGERLNFKITWPEDWLMAQALALNKSPEGRVRTGLGYDVHPLVPDRPLVLGGVRIEDSPLGLLGHSDADLLAHAVADAVLGAAGLPDIGNLFPAREERWRGADSLELLRIAVEKVRAEGWRVSWVDAVIQAQVPRLNAHLPAMRDRLSAVLNPGGALCVNLKAKSAEGIGNAGRGGSMNCWATATLVSERGIR